MDTPVTGIEMRSLITPQGQLRITLDPVTLAEPAAEEVVVAIEAAPINPSDIGLLIGPADVATLRAEGTADAPILVADVPAQRLPAVAGRIGQALPVGNEGAGTVVRAGSSVQHLLGRKVAMIGGGMFATVRKLPASDTLLLPECASAVEGAALFVNPLTALGFVETMRAEGHSAIVHTAAASNLGQMLVRICRADGIPLVNIVRSAAQVELLRGIGAEHIVDSSAPDFKDQLVEAIAATGAMLAFDAVGGGRLASDILNAMEVVALRGQSSYSRYGSDVRKQVYIYGALDVSPVTLSRQFGFSWNVGGWLLLPFLLNASAAVSTRMRERVIAERTTTFASHYTAAISLAEALNPATAAAFERKATGEKYLIDPRL